MASEADKVIAACREAYAKCKSYRDRSRFTRSGPYQTAATPKSGTYETRFARPGSLRIDLKYHEGTNHDVLWWVDGIAKGYFSEQDATTTRDFAPLTSLLVQKAGDVPFHVPTLLLVQQFEHWDFFKDYKITVLSEASEKVEGVDCHVLSGEDFKKEVQMVTRTKVWIGKADRLIRKLEFKHEISGTVVETVVGTIKPELDVKLERSDFVFKPPASAVERD